MTKKIGQGYGYGSYRPFELTYEEWFKPTGFLNDQQGNPVAVSSYETYFKPTFTGKGYETNYGSLYGQEKYKDAPKGYVGKPEIVRTEKNGTVIYKDEFGNQRFISPTNYAGDPAKSYIRKDQTIGGFTTSMEGDLFVLNETKKQNQEKLAKLGYGDQRKQEEAYGNYLKWINGSDGARAAARRIKDVAETVATQKEIDRQLNELGSLTRTRSGNPQQGMQENRKKLEAQIKKLDEERLDYQKNVDSKTIRLTPEDAYFYAQNADQKKSLQQKYEYLREETDPNFEIYQERNAKDMTTLPKLEEAYQKLDRKPTDYNEFMKYYGPLANSNGEADASITNRYQNFVGRNNQAIADLGQYNQDLAKTAEQITKLDKEKNTLKYEMVTPVKTWNGHPYDNSKFIARAKNRIAEIDTLLPKLNEELDAKYQETYAKEQKYKENPEFDKNVGMVYYKDEGRKKKFAVQFVDNLSGYDAKKSSFRQAAENIDRQTRMKLKEIDQSKYSPVQKVKEREKYLQSNQLAKKTLKQQERMFGAAELQKLQSTNIGGPDVGSEQIIADTPTGTLAVQPEQRSKSVNPAMNDYFNMGETRGFDYGNQMQNQMQNQMKKKAFNPSMYQDDGSGFSMSGMGEHEFGSYDDGSIDLGKFFGGKSSRAKTPSYTGGFSL